MKFCFTWGILDHKFMNIIFYLSTSWVLHYSFSYVITSVNESFYCIMMLLDCIEGKKCREKYLMILSSLKMASLIFAVLHYFVMIITGSSIFMSELHVRLVCSRVYAICQLNKNVETKSQWKAICKKQCSVFLLYKPWSQWRAWPNCPRFMCGPL